MSSMTFLKSSMSFFIRNRHPGSNNRHSLMKDERESSSDQASDEGFAQPPRVPSVLERLRREYERGSCPRVAERRRRSLRSGASALPDHEPPTPTSSSEAALARIAVLETLPSTRPGPWLSVSGVGCQIHQTLPRWKTVFTRRTPLIDRLVHSDGERNDECIC